ncbi:M91 family zinc metallopeptidase [Glaciimonas sp. Gout2]|uniref:eCIS core domain-containing protein n=1 Tax=unclassified Glaciimonas TaxID=2644401 RepID=UPI002B23C328|nr:MULTISPECIES: M91 family zinc metallopeptidase [unclassified Glaciimonas]MEB0011268.1 M91 family zinc metallopeptidase [Glaciimonas sp. Cout2]MEB0080918.1 M91 family zinc metallopeptidase [Glaciimonas sp. Gout2]
MKAPLQAPVQEDQIRQSDTAQRAPTMQTTRDGGFVDNRPVAVAQRELQEMINNSPRVLQQKAFADMINNSPCVVQQKAQMNAIQNSPRMVAQRQKMDALFGGTVQREEDQASHDSPEPAQALESPVQAKSFSDAPAQLTQAPAVKPNNTGLPDQLKSGIESMSGMSMDHVKVHYNSSQPAQLNARAYAQGSDIHLGPGQEQHLPHEAWHVVQQAQGRVRPTIQMRRDLPINDDVALEHEADVMGARALGAAAPADHDQAMTQTATERKPHGAGLIQRRLTFSGRAELIRNALNLLNGAYRVGLPPSQDAQLNLNIVGEDAYGQPKFSIVEAAQPDRDGIGSYLIGKIIQEGDVNIFFGEKTNDARPSNAEQAHLGNASAGEILLREGATAIELVHELIHTYHFQFDPWNAVQKEQQVDNGAGAGTVSAEEASTVGLGQWADFVLTENAFRAKMNLPLRTEY